jgi:hypothetical protein
MAIGFGPPGSPGYGVGLTDIVTSALSAASPTQRTWSFWWLAVDGTSFARVINRYNAGVEESSFVFPAGPIEAVPILSFRQLWGGGLAEWTWTIAQEGSPLIHHTAITYDLGSTTNDPTVYQDGATLTVGSGLTEVLAPSGSVVNNAVPLAIGNRPAQDRVLFGWLAEVAEWNRILSGGEILALTRGVTPECMARGLTEYFPFARSAQSRIVGPPTVTGTAVQPHPRVQGFRPSVMRGLGTYPTLQAFIGEPRFSRSLF